MVSRGPEDQTPFDMATRARAVLKSPGAGSRGIKVTCWMLEGPPIIGLMTGVSPVNSWVKVGGQRVPLDYVRRLQIGGRDV